jgi:hypothetical protein
MSAPDVSIALDVIGDEPHGTPAEIAAATRTANGLARAFIDSGDATYTERAALADDYRAALRHLRELNGGAAIHLDALSPEA